MFKKLIILLAIGLTSACAFHGAGDSPYVYDGQEDGDLGDDGGDLGDDEGDSEDDEGGDEDHDSDNGGS